MNVLSSTNPSSLTSTPVNPPSLQLQSLSASSSQTKATLTTESHITLGMAFTSNSTPPPTRPTSDRVIATNSAESVPVEHPRSIKMEEGGIDNEKSAMVVDNPLKIKNEESASFPREKSFEPTENATAEQPKLEEVTIQLKAIAEFFKTLSSTTSTLDTAVSPLNSLMVKKLDQEEVGSDRSSLEALHQLGWQLIRLGRNASTSPTSSIPTDPCPSRVSECRQQPFNFSTLNTPSLSPPILPKLPIPSQKPSPTNPQPPSSLSGVSMRGNQKYSAFYRHSKKHQVMEETESFRKPPTTTVPPFHRLGLPSRHLNGPVHSSQARLNMPNSSTSLEPGAKPPVMGQRAQSELASLPRNRETAFICSCGDDFENLYGFTLHMRDTGHKPRSSQPERDIPKLVRGQDMWINSETEQTREILRCMRCNQSFRSLPELTMHMMKTSHYSEIVYSDAARNILASQTFSSVAERNHAGGSANNTSWHSGGLKASALPSSPMPLKRSIRNSAPLQSEFKIADSCRTHKNKLNGQSEDHCIAMKLPRLDETQKCARRASSYEMQGVNPSPKLITSPETQSCPSELQQSNKSSPRNEVENQEPKYLSSPNSSSENASPQVLEMQPPRQGCTDSVIRQIESFVENSLPFSCAPSPVTSRPSTWPSGQQISGLVKPPNLGGCNIAQLKEADKYRSIHDTNVHGKRPYSNESASCVAVNKATAGTTSTQSALLPSFSDSIGLENPLSSLQKLVETTHRSATGLKSPVRPFSQTSDASPAPSNHSVEMEVSGVPTSAVEANQHQFNMAATLSAIRNLMFKASTSSTSNSAQQSHKPSPNLGNTNWMEFLDAFLTLTKQSNSDGQRLDPPISPSSVPFTSRTLEQPSVIFPGGGFEFSPTQSIPAHADSTLAHSTGPNPVTSTNKKAKCHFCGKPFANKGQVRLHISKNKCPCLLQQSSSSSGGISPLIMDSQALEKRGLPLSCPAYSPADFSRFYAQLPPSHIQPSTIQTLNTPTSQSQSSSQQNSIDSKPPTEAAALAALLRHFRTPPTSHPSDLFSSPARSSETNSGSTSGSTNPFLSLLFPSTGTASPSSTLAQSAEISGLTSDQKALVLFAQAIMSLAVASPSPAARTGQDIAQRNPLPPPQLPTYPPPSASLLQNFNVPSMPSPEVAITPEALDSYLSAICHLASLGNAAPAASTSTVAESKTTGSLQPPLTGAERLT